MKLIRDALTVSGALDDPRPHGPGVVDHEHIEQLKAHEALVATAPRWVAPPADLRALVEVRVRSPRAQRRSEMPLWPLAAAAILTLASGTAWLVSRAYSPTPTLTPAPGPAPLAENGSRPAPAVPAGRPALAIDPTVLVQLPQRSEDVLLASVEGALIREAQLLREDTRRGFEVVRASLPLGR